jgi:hypothetical protein
MFPLVKIDGLQLINIVSQVRLDAKILGMPIERQSIKMYKSLWEA